MSLSPLFKEIYPVPTPLFAHAMVPGDELQQVILLLKYNLSADKVILWQVNVLIS